jgi:hypothetical protein
MSDKIGVLGEDATNLSGTNVVYTVGAGKAAKCQIMLRIQGAADGSSDVEIKVNALSVGIITNMGSSQFTYSNATAALMVASTATAPTGATVATTVAPAPGVYYLAAADTISYVVTGSELLAVNVQVVGTEIDV